MQNKMRGTRLAKEAMRLLEESRAREEMKAGLAEVAARLSGESDPMERAASIVRQVLKRNQGVSHVA